MAGTSQTYDRVLMTLFGAPYLQNGSIIHFRGEGDFNSTLVQGMTSTGVASGFVVGNQALTITWEEIYDLGGEFVDIVSLIRNNPASATGQLVVQPIAVGATLPTAPAVVFTGLVLPRATLLSTPGQGQYARREVTLLATQFNYL